MGARSQGSGRHCSLGLQALLRHLEALSDMFRYEFRPDRRKWVPSLALKSIIDTELLIPLVAWCPEPRSWLSASPPTSAARRFPGFDPVEGHVFLEMQPTEMQQKAAIQRGPNTAVPSSGHQQRSSNS